MLAAWIKVEAEFWDCCLGLIVWQVDGRAAKSANCCSFPRGADETADNSVLTLQGQRQLLAALSASG